MMGLLEEEKEEEEEEELERRTMLERDGVMDDVVEGGRCTEGSLEPPLRTLDSLLMGRGRCPMPGGCCRPSDISSFDSTATRVLMEFSS